MCESPRLLCQKSSLVSLDFGRNAVERLELTELTSHSVVFILTGYVAAAVRRVRVADGESEDLYICNYGQQFS